MYAIGAKFFGDVVLPVARACGNTLIMSAIHSYLKLCDVIDQLARNHYGLYVSPVVLQEKATAWANSLFDTYGQTMFWPKTHKTFAHLADQLQRRKGHAYKAAHLPSCWAQDDTYVINVQLTIIAQRL
jgi:hypothetical protein